MANSTTFTDFIINAEQLNNLLGQEVIAIDKYDLEAMSRLLPEKQILCDQNEHLINCLSGTNLSADQKKVLIEWLESLQTQIQENLETLDQAIDLYNHVLGIKVGKNLNQNPSLYSQNRKLGIRNIPITTSRKL